MRRWLIVAFTLGISSAAAQNADSGGHTGRLTGTDTTVVLPGGATMVQAGVTAVVTAMVMGVMMAVVTVVAIWIVVCIQTVTWMAT